MFLTFENEKGKVNMGGGCHPLWNITSIVGTGLPSKDFNVVKYTNQDGQETLSEVSTERTITIGGDIRNNGQLQHEVRQAIRVFNSPGALKLQLGNVRRKIFCRVNSFEEVERNGATLPFVLQLVCDKPHFEDFSNTSINVFQTADMVGGDNILPMVLTQRTSEARAINMGGR